MKTCSMDIILYPNGLIETFKHEKADEILNLVTQKLKLSKWECPLKFWQTQDENLCFVVLLASLYVLNFI